MICTVFPSYFGSQGNTIQYGGKIKVLELDRIRVSVLWLTFLWSAFSKNGNTDAYVCCALNNDKAKMCLNILELLHQSEFVRRVNPYKRWRIQH